MIELPPDEYRALVAEVARQAAVSGAATADAARADVARALEATLLRADATEAEIERLCGEALRLGYAGVCVNPAQLAPAVAALRGSKVLAITVVDFPLGAGLGSAKLAQADACLRLGADELDLMMNLGALKAGRDAQMQAEIVAVAALAHDARARLKVILETALLDESEKRRAGRLAIEAGADFLKTSTGTIPGGGATVEDVVLLRSLAPAHVGIKAAGGIRTPAQAHALLAAGASRLGCSQPSALLG